MGEGASHTSVDGQAGSKQTLTIVVAGTAVAVLGAGVLFQILRAEPGGAAVRPGDPQESQTGTSRVSSPSRSRVMAKVNGEIIDYDTVARECVTRYGKDVLEKIINRTIIQQACEKEGIRITEREVNAEVTRIAKEFNLEVDLWYQMLQVERNINPQQYRRDIIWPMLALRKLVREDLTVTPEDRQKAFVRDYGPRVKAKMIMLDNERRAREVWRKAHEHPEEFGRLARQYSVDPHSRPLDGKIPPIRKYSGNEELTKVAFNLKEGEVSGIIQVGVNQYVILLCEGFTKPIVSKEDFHTVKKELTERLKEEKRQQSVAKVFQKLKEQATIDNYLVYSRKKGVRQTSAEKTGLRRSGTPVRSGSGTKQLRPLRNRATPER